MNSIDAKQYNFLQQNLPGNDGYGQIGVRGNTGIDGNSVYFTPYVMYSLDVLLSLLGTRLWFHVQF